MFGWEKVLYLEIFVYQILHSKMWLQQHKMHTMQIYAFRAQLFKANDVVS